jgi:hypothetical protein
MITNKAEFIDPLVDFKHKKDLKKKREREHRHVSKNIYYDPEVALVMRDPVLLPLY